MQKICLSQVVNACLSVIKLPEVVKRFRAVVTVVGMHEHEFGEENELGEGQCLKVTKQGGVMSMLSTVGYDSNGIFVTMIFC